MEEVFKKAEISEGVNVDGENLSNLRFADDVALLNETSKQMEKHMNNLNSESMKVGLKIHKGKTKYMTNYADNEDILIGQQKIEKVTEFKYLGQTTHLKDTTKEEIYARIRAGWSCFGKNKEILQDKQLPNQRSSDGQTDEWSSAGQTNRWSSRAKSSNCEAGVKRPVVKCWSTDQWSSDGQTDQWSSYGQTDLWSSGNETDRALWPTIDHWYVRPCYVTT